MQFPRNLSYLYDLESANGGWNGVTIQMKSVSQNFCIHCSTVGFLGLYKK